MQTFEPKESDEVSKSEVYLEGMTNMDNISLGIVGQTAQSPMLKRTHRYWEVSQRVLDVIICSASLCLLFPIFFLIALLIKLDSPGSVLFVQTRIGRNGQPFHFYKFRSMVRDAPEKRCELDNHNERTGPVFKMRNDPRVTRVGRWIRRLSLDELPQLLNVLKGEMSLVGPRPALPEEVSAYTPYERQRLLVTPGLTGLWQVSGRARLSFEESIRLDLYYIEHQSLWLNLAILLKTLPVVILGDGAF